MFSLSLYDTVQSVMNSKFMGCFAPLMSHFVSFRKSK